jgi:hypothetical protein
MSSRMSSLKLRMVPRISTLSGMMFSRTPPRMVPTVTTAGSWVMFRLRLTTVCSPSTTWAAVTIGSTPIQGAAPWVWRPCTVIFSGRSWPWWGRRERPARRWATRGDVQAEDRLRHRLFQRALGHHHLRRRRLRLRVASLRPAGR